MDHINEVRKTPMYYQMTHSTKVLTMGPFIYYVITFLGFLDPPPPLRQHVFSTKNKQKLAGGEYALVSNAHIMFGRDKARNFSLERKTF